ncbi:MAG TPA: O-antigen ligase family protein [Vicinamibacterales bacterium]|nr:O-antigen ligase family protein [Vicinamibacterales bacterium]
MGSLTLFAGVALLMLAAPFELTEPLVRLPRQSISSLETAVLVAFAVSAVAAVRARTLPQWRTPLTAPWAALIAAMLVASLASPVSRVNALHMTGRVAAAFGVYLLTVNGITTRRRLRAVLGLAVGVGLVVAILAILEFLGVAPVLSWLKVFRPGVATVGAQVRAGGPLQYPTIASMYLEVVFAFGLGVLLAAVDAGRIPAAAAIFIALAVVAEGVIITFTRAGVITMAASLVFVVAVRAGRNGIDRGVRGVAALGLVVAALFFSSRSAQSMWLRFTTEGQDSWYRARVSAPSDLEIPTGQVTVVPVSVTNVGRLPWDSSADPPMRFSYHWLGADGDGFVTFEGARTPFATIVAPGETVSVAARVRPPRQPGRYRLEWDLVQEGRLWFSTEPGAPRQMSRVVVSGDAADAPAVASIAPPTPTVRPGRLVLWRAAIRMIATHPLVGVGPDNFRLAYGPYAGLQFFDTRTHSNNMYLEMLAGGGLLAFTAFAWLLWNASGCVAAGLRPAADRGNAIAAGVAAAAMAIALHATVDSFVSFAPTYVLFSLTLGCASACARGVEGRLDANRI